MSTVFTKNKGKRSRSSSSEENNSFMKNVTSRVTGLLPSTITKWFSSSSSSNANGSTQTADATDSSTEDEANDTPVVSQPLAKRRRFSSSNYNHFSPTDVNCSTSINEVPEVQPYSSFSGTQISPTRITPNTTLRNPEDTNQDKDTPPVYRPHSQFTVAGIGQSIANKRKSIFETSLTKEDSVKACTKSSVNTPSDVKRPRFKPSLLGSPFYPGRTMYGGASSSYINEPDIRHQKVALVNESKNSDDTMLSSSARRIMDLLESYSSPIMEARRIPQYTRPKNDSVNLSGRYDPYGTRSISNRTQELHVPSIASILQLKKKSRLMDSTNAARQIIASHSSASNYPSYPLHNPQPGNSKEAEPTTKMTNKVKTKVTRTNRKQDELEVISPVNLPNTPLNIVQLPVFTLNTPVKNNLLTSSTPKVSSVYNQKSSEIVSKSETRSSSMFKFSKPVKISIDTPEPVTTSSKFTFVSPERQVDNVERKSDFTPASSESKEAEKPAATKDWQCGDCWVKNKADADKCLCCGGKKPTAAGKCSVCKKADSQPQKDKCDGCLKVGISQVASSLPKTPSTESASWKCGDCWVNNSNSDKCVCCGSKRPQSNAASVPPPAAVPAAAAAANADWKCGDCWITNKSSETKCAACGGNRPGSKPVAQKLPAFAKQQDGDIKQNNIPKTIWECSGCLVRNDIEQKKCVCCGTLQNKIDSAPEEKFSFGKNLPSFKFGIPTAQEATLEKKTEVNTIVVEKPKENSETNNNVLNETPTFTFGIPAKKDNKIDVPKEATPTTFMFAMPKQTTTIALVSPKPQEPTKSVDEEKPQEVPSVNFKTATDKISQPSTNLFTSIISPKSTQEKPATSVSPSLNLLEASKDTLKNPVSLAPIVTSAEQSQPSSTFTFGTKTNLFTAPATTSSSSNLFPIATTQAPETSIKTPSLFTPPKTTSQITATTTSAPTLSLFKPPESGSSSLFTLVQKCEANVTSTPAAPVFSFGSNAAAAPAAAPATVPDKPKFQFTFGSNTTPKTDAPALFKSPFGSGSDNNTFSLPTSGTLGMGGNALGGSNGLPVANGLSMGALTGNTLSGNSLSSNSLGGHSISANPLTGANNVIPNPLGGTNGMATNPLTVGNNLQANNSLGASPGMFGNPSMNENVWSASSPQTNLFVSNTSTNSSQKPAAFTFGSATPFNATSSTPAFGTNATPAPNIFGLGNQNNSSQPSMFSSPVQSQPQANIFGSPPAPSNANQPVLFGASNVAAVSAFGANNSIPSFEAPSLAPSPAPAFNFGAPQATGVFGFGQQQAAAPTGAVYSFGGGAATGAPQVQFNMGTGANANPPVRRVRKAVRRNPQR